MRSGHCVTSFLVASVLVGGILAPSALANATDPLNDRVWPVSFGGTYRWGPNLTLGWMRTQASAAIATIGHSDARNPDFHLTTSSSSNGVVDMKNGHTTSCPDGHAHYHYGWLACADPSADLTWFVWLTNLGTADVPDWCWWDGVNTANRTCSGTPSQVETYDVQSVVLNEMGHVNELGHHDNPDPVNPDYANAVVQAKPVHYNHAYWSNRVLRRYDLGALRSRYGYDCGTPPCPSSVEP